MHYSNHDSRLQGPDAATDRTPQKFLSLERGAKGVRLRMRTAATMARRKLVPLGLPAAAVFVLAACVTPLRVAKAQLGYDPFAANAVHTEERWTTYSDATTAGTNRPTATAINGVDSTATNQTAFNFAVTAPSTATSGAFATSGGNIYSPSSALTLTLTSGAAVPVGTFNTVVFSIKTLGNPLNLAGVLLTLNGGAGQTVAPRFTNTVNSGSGMGAAAQSAFQFDLSSYGGSNNFTITVPGSASSVSFSASQLDATTTVYGAQSVVPEPSTVAAVLAAMGSLSVAAWRRRRG